MQTRPVLLPIKRIALWAVVALMLWKLRMPLWQAAVQLLWGIVLAFCALPLMKWLEKRLPAGAAAGLALAGLLGCVAGGVLLLVPALIRQGERLAGLLPPLFETAEEWLAGGRAWLEANGISVQGAALERFEKMLSTVMLRAAAWLKNFAAGISRFLLAPAFAYYFLRDRKMFAAKLILLLPVRLREVSIRIFREMRRETAGYLRGQMILSAAVGSLTALGLLLCGVPSWLMLGTVMGILEWIPYAGPAAGGVLAVLFALPGGLTRTLWALAAVIAVQQIEGSVLSPQLMSSATRLHPAAVLLCLMIGASAGGMTGLLTAVPVVLCVRAALRVISLAKMDEN